MKKGYSRCIFISFYITPSKRVYMTQVNSFKTVKRGKRTERQKHLFRLQLRQLVFFFFFFLNQSLLSILPDINIRIRITLIAKFVQKQGICHGHGAKNISVNKWYRNTIYGIYSSNIHIYIITKKVQTFVVKRLWCVNCLIFHHISSLMACGQNLVAGIRDHALGLSPTVHI